MAYTLTYQYLPQLSECSLCHPNPRSHVAVTLCILMYHIPQLLEGAYLLQYASSQTYVNR